MVDLTPLKEFEEATYKLLRTENANTYNKYDALNILSDAYVRILRNKKHETRTTKGVAAS